jgi:hypothetical protein
LQHNSHFRLSDAALPTFKRSCPMRRTRRILSLSAALLLLSISCQLLTPSGPAPGELPSQPDPDPDPEPSAAPGLISGPTPTLPVASEISLDAMLSTLEDLTAIQPYSGWRNSASSGEREALDYMQARVEEMDFLQLNGLTTERQEFSVILGTEFHQSDLTITINSTEYNIPASATRGPRDELGQALLFDSDGSLDDNDPDPVEAQADTVAVLDPAGLAAIRPEDARDRILLLNYALFDRALFGIEQPAADLSRLIGMQPAGLLFITQFSNTIGESHGTFLGDNSALNWVRVPDLPPVLYARMEDMSSAGIQDWEDLRQIESARLVWDVDVRSPAQSGNLITYVPGEDSDRALILSAHIDSPNSPGALDNGSGSAILLEILRYLNETGTIPPVDLVFVWFGSEEIGLYGSFNFAASRQDLLDRSLGVLNFDCLTRPLDGITAAHNFVGWSYARFGSPELAWADYLSELAGDEGIRTETLDVPYIYSDNSAFTAYNLPNVNMIYQNEAEMNQAGQVWYAGHLHDPYDTVELAAESGEALVEMARLGLAAVLNPPEQRPNIGVVPEPLGRVVYVGSRSEVVHMTPSSFFDFNMLLGTYGLDVDHIPYNTAVTKNALAGAHMVIVLPVSDYPVEGINEELYDSEWTGAELDVLEDYARGGGLLVITNSANRLKYANLVYETNEDWRDMNALAERFGAEYLRIPDQTVSTSVSTGASMLLPASSRIRGADRNTLGIEALRGEILAVLKNTPTMVLLDAGDGRVLLLGDVGFLSSSWGDLTNQPFWEGLAEFMME